MNGRILGATLLLLIFFASCHKPESTLEANFSFCVGDEPLQLDTCRYVNAAGNYFSIHDVQFFISELTLINERGEEIDITSADNFITYVDVSMPETLNKKLTRHLPAGKYSALKFVFGIRNELNLSQLFVNPPENNMSWPAMLGGGYHYMKINGHWQTAEGMKSFGLHTGVGMLEDGTRQDNSFEVVYPLDNFVVVGDVPTTLQFTMDIQQWFENPEIYNLDYFGGSIMQNAEAQSVLKANGQSVFKITFQNN